MNPDADRDRERRAEYDLLRRIAFGRVSNESERVAAAEAHAALDALMAEDAARAETASADAARAIAAQATAAHSDAELAREAHPPVVDDEPAGAASPAHPHGEPWRAWVVPALVALVIGAVVSGASVAGLSHGGLIAGPGPTHTNTATFTPGSSTLPPRQAPTTLAITPGQAVQGSPGFWDAAMLWFQHEQTDGDLSEFDDTNPMDLDLTSTRLVHTNDTSSIWVAMTIDGQLCLIVNSSTQSSTATACVTRDQFEQTGLAVVSHTALLVAWDGNRLLTSMGAE